MRFALGSFYCAAGNMEKGPRSAFAQTDYKALSGGGLRRELGSRDDIRMGYVAFAVLGATTGRRTTISTVSAIAAANTDADLFRPSRRANMPRPISTTPKGRYGRAKQAFTAFLRSDAYRDVVPYYLLQIEFREGNYRYVVENGETLARRAVPERRAELERVVANRGSGWRISTGRWSTSRLSGRPAGRWTATPAT